MLPGLMTAGHVARLSNNAATVICKQLRLGSNAVVSAQSAFFPPVEKTGIVWVDTDRCDGTESDALSCLSEASRGESSSPLYQVACLDPTGVTSWVLPSVTCWSQAWGRACPSFSRMGANVRL